MCAGCVNSLLAVSFPVDNTGVGIRFVDAGIGCRGLSDVTLAGAQTSYICVELLLTLSLYSYSIPLRRNLKDTVELSD